MKANFDPIRARAARMTYARTMRLVPVLAAAFCLGPTRFVSAAMTVDEQRCEYALNPIGIDTLQPRLSWTLKDDRRGQRQSAYQICVADSPDALSRNKPLLWDTGKVASDQNTHIAYAGAALRSGERCYWKVRVWDKQGQPSPWSAPSLWQVARLQASDWKSKWIGFPGDVTPSWSNVTVAADITLLTNAVGIVFRAKDSSNFYMWQLNNCLGPDLLLRPHIQKHGQWSMLREVSLRQIIPPAADFKMHRVEIEATGTLIRTRIDGQLVDERNDTTFTTGSVGFRADSKERFAVDNLVVTTGGAAGPVVRDDFSTGSTAFQKATVESGQLLVSGVTLLHRPPLTKECPRLRKAFTVEKPVQRATASVCGLGFYELYVNGKKADGRALAPANTPYSQRLLFDTIDLTSLITPGANALGIWLAPGYSDDYSQWGWKWEDAKRAILQLDMVYADGTSATVVTDETWQAGPGPITFASLYDGEVYDARLEAPGWATSSYAAEGWQPACVLEATAAKLAPNVMPPVRVTQRLRPVGVSEPKLGVFVFDMGQNFAGWVSVRATGTRGTRIVLRHSELVGENGMLDPWTNRRAQATDTFVLRGDGLEVYEPRFTYHGFRYVEVTGYPGKPTLDDVTGCVVHADVQPAGAFLSSDAVINRIHSNCVWSMRSNLMSIPTDCCMRDERTPCQMDSLAYEDAAFCNFRMNRYYTKWLGDIQGGRGNPDWNGDMVFLPWRLYRHNGDIRILEDNYANMRAFVEALHERTPGHIYTEGFGDWCPPNDGSWAGYHGDVTEVNTSLYAALARIVCETAALLGKSEDAARYAKLSEDVTRAFNEKRFDAETATYGDGSQSTAILPLALNLVPQDRRAAVSDRLVATIRGKDKGHLDTGIFGLRYLLDVLCDIGQADLAVSMLMQSDYPGFGFQLAQGATTLWEQWTAKGDMNSHNHAMFAGLDASFFTRLAGMTATKPGYAEINIRPCLPAALTFVEASQSTVKGRVSVRWERKGAELELKVSVPVNTTARVAVPAADPQAVTENGLPAAKAEGVQYIGAEGAYAIFDIGSGDYRFLARPSH